MATLLEIPAPSQLELTCEEFRQVTTLLSFLIQRCQEYTETDVFKKKHPGKGDSVDINKVSTKWARRGCQESF